MKNIFVFTLLTLVSVSGLGCLNEFDDYYSEDGEEFYGLRTYYRAIDTNYSERFVAYYDLTEKDSYPYEELNDLSVHLAKLGRFEESLDLLLWLNASHPDEYQICANLGTVYELNGNVDSAYFFIQRSMQINPDSHNGSEWVHLGILKAKKELARNKNWLATHQVLDLKLDQAVDVNSAAYAQILDTLEAIDYQLYERVPFSSMNDPILADIFDELGDILAKHFSLEDAYVAYNISLQYGSGNKSKTEEKIRNITALVHNSDYGIPELENTFPPADEFAPVYDDFPGAEATPKKYIHGEPVTAVYDNNSVGNVLIWLGVSVGVSLLGLLVFKITR